MANLTENLRTTNLDLGVPDMSGIPSTASIFAETAKDVGAFALKEHATAVENRLVSDLDAEAAAGSTLVNPESAQASKDFAGFIAKTVSGRNQGIMTAAEAQVRMHSKLREYSARYPALASDFRGIANPIIGLHTEELKIAQKQQAETNKQDWQILNEILKQGQKEFGLNPHDAMTDPVGYASRYDAWMQIKTEAALRSDEKSRRELLIQKNQLEQSRTNLTSSQLELLNKQDERNQLLHGTAHAPKFMTDVDQAFVPQLAGLLGKDQSTTSLAEFSDRDIESLSNRPDAPALISQVDQYMATMKANIAADYPQLSQAQQDNITAGAVAHLKIIRGMLDKSYTSERVKTENDYLEQATLSKFYKSPKFGTLALNLKALATIVPKDSIAAALMNEKVVVPLADEFAAQFNIVAVGLLAEPSKDNGLELGGVLVQPTDPRIMEAEADMFKNAVTQATVLSKQGGPRNKDEQGVYNAGRNSIYSLAAAIKGGGASSSAYDTLIDALSNPDVKPFLMEDKDYPGKQIAQDIQPGMQQYLKQSLLALQASYKTYLKTPSELPDYHGLTGQPIQIQAGSGGIINVPMLSYGDLITGSIQSDGTIVFSAKNNRDNKGVQDTVDRANRNVAPKLNKMIRTWAHLTGTEYRDAAGNMLIGDINAFTSPESQTQEIERIINETSKQ